MTLTLSLLLILSSSSLQTQNTQQPTLVPQLPIQSRVSVYPLLFVPSDATLMSEEAMSAKKLIASHLELAREHYRKLLKTDTFVIYESDSSVFRSGHENSFFVDAPNDNSDGRPMRILQELFAWNGEDRYSSNRVYLLIYKRPGGSGSNPLIGGGRTLNGVPNTGGGYIEMEYSALMSDSPYPFQSTLVHELGHSFGLSHCDCNGYDLSTNMSIMSYNTNHWSKGLTQSSESGGLNPEEYFVLSLNKRAFPDFEYNEQIHNPDGKPFDTEKIQQCFLGAMGPGIGAFRHFEGVGFELFFNGKKVNGPEAALWPYYRAFLSLSTNAKNHGKQVKVEGRYNGKVMKTE